MPEESLMALLPHLPGWPEIVGRLLGVLLVLVWLGATLWLLVALARVGLRLLP
jgi:hypothetical protein